MLWRFFLDRYLLTLLLEQQFVRNDPAIHQLNRQIKCGRCVRQYCASAPEIGCGLHNEVNGSGQEDLDLVTSGIRMGANFAGVGADDSGGSGISFCTGLLGGFIALIGQRFGCFYVIHIGDLTILAK